MHAALADNNELLSYVPSRRVLEEGGMEGWTAMLDYGLPARYATDVEERIMGLVAELAEGCGLPTTAGGASGLSGKL